MSKTPPTPDARELEQLIDILPAPLQSAVRPLLDQALLEIVLDLGRMPEARLAGRAVKLADTPIGREDLDQVTTAVGEFGADNRAGIEGTLHRISAIRNRRGEVVGLTLRVGRAVYGTIDLIRDLVESGSSILLLGRPGVGKTTKLREMARVLADDLLKRVIVIDTSNEVAGDGDIPHPAIGGARRMQVARPERQHAVMIEAVENHMPEVIIIDEIGTVEEAAAARTIAERGVQLIGTAHGTTLDNLVRNPTLSDLVGGVQTVTLGDDEARLRGTQKTVSERKGPPTFDVVVEIVNRDEVVIHPNSGESVDTLLRGLEVHGIRRTPDGEEAVVATDAVKTSRPREATATAGSRNFPEGTVRIYPYGLSRDSVDRVIRSMKLNARTVAQPDRAQLVLSLRSRADDARLGRILSATGLPLHTVKKNTTAQIRRLFQTLFNIMEGSDEEAVRTVVHETEVAVLHVLQSNETVELAPQPPALRELQHRIIVRHQLLAESRGSEPNRHLVILPRSH